MKNLILYLIISIPIFLMGQDTNTFPASGFAGIGTLSPQADLHVSKTGSQAGFIVQRTDGSWFKAAAGAVGSGFLFKSDARLVIGPVSDINSGSADAENSLYLFGSTHPTYPGRLVLGTAIPGDNSKFTVNGRIRSEELKIVNNVEAPDYVFAQDYNLMSIEEVESFVKQKSHLPEIPSAAEFKENGIIVGQMTFDLLKKVEELTLYIIDLNKKIKQLESQISNLK
jgi:hypothetical protein